MDVSLEIGLLNQLFRFPHHRVLAAGGDGSSLMEGDGAEIAGAETAPIMGDGEFHLFNGGDAALCFINRVIGSLIGQLKHMVQLFLGQGHGRWILHHNLMSVALDDPFSPNCILLVLLFAAGHGVFPFGSADLLKAGTVHGRAGLVFIAGNNVTGSPDVRHGFDGFPCIQPPRDFQRLALAHAEGKQVCTRIQQNGGADFVFPIIIMGETAERSFQSADHHGNIGIQPLENFRIDNYGAVGTASGLFSRRIGVVAAAFPCGGIVGHHGIQIAGIAHESQTGTAEALKVPVGFPVGLGQNRHPIPGVLQHPGNNGGAEGVVIHIGISGHQDEIHLIPSPLTDFLHGNG